MKLHEQLQQQQDLLLNAVKGFGQFDYKKQYHPDLSPAGWHLGHCIFTESHWLREVVMGLQQDTGQLKTLYIPELSYKPSRSEAIPPLSELCLWAEQQQQENRGFLTELLQRRQKHELLTNSFLIHFLLQHYAQHYETVMLNRIQQAITGQEEFTVSRPLTAVTPGQQYISIRTGEYPIGNQATHAPYDNEAPHFFITVDQFNIAANPVSNGEYLAFMEAGGYTDKTHWSDDGWQWCLQLAAGHPQHWCRDQHGHWYGHNSDGPYELTATAPVYGINYYEACAYARWTGAALPHEYQWEIASQAGVLQQHGQVWEWCANPFHPYSGFRAYPYDGYSLPYFDGKHISLRGGSCYTRPAVKRPTFRNYYQANKRHIHAGVRLIYR